MLCKRYIFVFIIVVIHSSVLYDLKISLKKKFDLFQYSAQLLNGKKIQRKLSWINFDLKYSKLSILMYDTIMVPASSIAPSPYHRKPFLWIISILSKKWILYFNFVELKKYIWCVPFFFITVYIFAYLSSSSNPHFFCILSVITFRKNDNFLWKVVSSV